METPDIRVLVVQACRILFQEGHTALSGAAGHVSARVTDDTFIIKPATVGFDEVETEDLLTVGADGRRVGGKHALPEESAIHVAIYAANPGITAVVHTHPPLGTALSCTDRGVMPLSWTVGALGTDIPTYDPGTFLIRSPQEGAALAAALGARAALLLKNHGVVVVGRTVAEATMRAVMLENAIRLQWLAEGLGRPTVLGDSASNQMAFRYDERRFERMFAYVLRSGRYGDRRGGRSVGLSGG